MNRVVHFEIHASEPENLGRFYAGVFGWKVEEWKLPGVTPENRYWMVLTDLASSSKVAGQENKEPGINGGIVVRKGNKPEGSEPVSSFVCTIGVANVDEHLQKIEKAGGTTAMSKMPIPGVGWLAYCKDPEGNLFGIMQDDKEAG